MSAPFEIVGEYGTMCDPKTGSCAMPTIPAVAVSAPDATVVDSDIRTDAVGRRGTQRS